MATVFRADGETSLEFADPNVPFVYRDIMVGTKLTIIVSSDVAENWDGKLLIEGLDRCGTISTRDPNEVTPTRMGSVFEAAGADAAVYRFEDVFRTGVSMSAKTSVVAGDWFVFDYIATDVGNCSVDFYEVVAQQVVEYDPDNPPLSETIPIEKLVFSHAPTRDFNGDKKVDFIDFATMMAFRGVSDCAELNACEGTDLDLDGDVDSVDLMMFADYWLERTE